MTIRAILEALRFLRGLPEYQADRYICLIRCGYAIYRGCNVPSAAEEIGGVFHFIRQGLPDLLQPLDRRVFGALRWDIERSISTRCRRGRPSG
jgi:hypothetical protein